MNSEKTFSAVLSRGPRLAVTLLTISLLAVGIGTAQAAVPTTAGTFESREAISISATTTAGTLVDTHSATVRLLLHTAKGAAECSGVYVAPGKVLTAKHCVNTGLQLSRSGVFHTDQDLAAGNLVPITAYDTAPEYDVAVLTTTDTRHPIASIRTQAIRYLENLQHCGRNYAQPENYADDPVNAVGDSSHGPSCGNARARYYLSGNEGLNKYWVLTGPLLLLRGDSGGPVYDQDGQVVAVNSAMLQTSLSGVLSWYNGIAPLSDLKEWLENQHLLDVQLPQSEVAATGHNLNEVQDTSSRIAQPTPPPAPKTAPSPTPKTTPSPKPKPTPAAIGSWQRLSGKNRVATSIQTWRKTPGVKTVLLASGANPADGLAATQLAVALKGAVVLSMGSKSIDAPVMQEILRTGVKRVVRVGGRVGMSTQDRKRLAAAGVKVQDIAGRNRYDTAVKVARMRDSLVGKPKGVLVADGIKFPDALAAGAVAAREGRSLVLSSGTIPRETAAYLRTVNTEIIAVGGPAKQALAKSGFKFRQLVGATRYETASLVVKQGITWHKSATGKDLGTGLVLVSGADFPDALSGGSLSALSAKSLMLVSPTRQTRCAELNRLWKQYGHNSVIVGGHGALSEQAVIKSVQ